VRYLGFEEGIDGFKPSDPKSVFKRRFGDCKEKTFLLHMLLAMMDIPSTPVLVHTEEGKTIPELLPTAFGFNHIILRIEIGEEEYWVDSTLYSQGGELLEEIFCPIFYWGLPLSKQEVGLVEVPGNYSELPTLIETSVIFLSKEEAQMTIERTFHGHKADYMRRYLEWYGIHSLSDDFLGLLKKMYGKAAIDSPLFVQDKRDKNILVITESYRVPTQLFAGDRSFRVFSLTIQNYLDTGANPEGSSPYGLIFPLWVKEHIHLENPLVEWERESDGHTFEHESLVYSHGYQIEGEAQDFYYELKHLKDHVSVDSLFDYWEMTGEIESDGVLRVNLFSNISEAM